MPQPRNWRERESIGPGADQFETEIFPREIESINARRAALRRNRLDPPDTTNVVGTVGLALSGGGIRSAAFSLGVLQSLNQHDVIKRIDYLSTVSGGGYIGSALTATMTMTEGDFVFGGPPSPAGKPSASEISDTDPVAHIRNYSNYLIPYGFRDVMTAAAIVVRGLVANFGLVFPLMLIAAAITAVIYPNRYALDHLKFFGLWELPFFSTRSFGFAIVLSLFVVIGFFWWAVERSYKPVNELGEFRTAAAKKGGWALAAIVIVLFLELQPLALAGMFSAADTAEAEPGGVGLIGAVITHWKEWLVALAAPVTALVTFFNAHFADAIESNKSEGGWTSFVKAITARAAVWIAGAALPALIWMGYLYLSFWAIPNAIELPAIETPAIETTAATDCATESTPGTVNLTFELGAISGSADGTVTASNPIPCPEQADSPEADVRTPTSHRPVWLNGVMSAVHAVIIGVPERINGAPIFAPDSTVPPMISAVVLYLVFGGGVLYAAFLLRPNANSLSRLYQDRLSKAFLFDPNQSADASGIAKGRDFEPLDIQLSKLDNAVAPYHLINAAINVQGSDFANRRGRNADFFMFSPRYVGSAATGYVETELYEPDPPDLDLGKAMSISGAAFSSEMGSKSIRALAPTLTLLNVRLGYWLKNPKVIASEAEKKTWLEYSSGSPRAAPVYLLREMLGWLDENTPVVYVTDGGHIENLGLYELLRRRCKLILVVDAEADPTMDFPSFIELQRYARIDLGVRFSIPWKVMSDTTRAWMGVGSADNQGASAEPKSGPHVTIGRIEYGGDQQGFLVYVKASLTGDENDYIRDYARRYPKFPHETTSDQFFSEEQFEVYRALGFHAIDGFLSKRVKVLVDKKLRETAESAAAAAASEEPADSAAGNADRDASAAQPPAESSDAEVAEPQQSSEPEDADADPDLVAPDHPALDEVYRMLTTG